jgi:low temperature requirement protein LtrA
METIAAFGAAFVGSVAMWWLYFNIGAERATHYIRASTDPGQVARIAYTYVHLLLVAGIIVSAVGDGLILKDPHGVATAAGIDVLIGGPALYLIGNLLFKWLTAGWPPLSHLAGLALLAALIPLARHISMLSLGAAASLILVVVAVWELVSLQSRPSSETQQG